MKGFFKDLWSLQKESFSFIKKHPVGYTVFVIGSGLIGAAVAVGPYVVEKIKFTKELNDLGEQIIKGEEPEEEV